jgi:molybdopterin/thiamine biosynthesis adenylyltransferase
MGRTVVVVGQGNIGSHLAPLLARMPECTEMLLCDRDTYDRSNVATQCITPGEIGRGKAQVQALRLRRINPALRVTAIPEPVEHVPMGRLRGDVLLACVDNRKARQNLSETARHLGIPLVDGGVHADGLLARISVYPSHADAACLECSWTQHDYDAIEEAYPCDIAHPPAGTPASPAAPRTGAPAELGALAAALQAIECRRLLSGEPPRVEGAYEIVVDAHSGRTLVSRIPRNEHCRLADHAPWRIRRLAEGPEDITLAQALAPGSSSGSGTRLRLGHQRFVTRLRCMGCGDELEMLRLRRAIGDRERVCRKCRGRLEPTAADLVSSLTLDEMNAATRARTLRSLGFDAHDIFTVARDGAADPQHFELRGADARTVRR